MTTTRPTARDQAAQDREKRIHGLLKERDHAEYCPGIELGGGRLEAYDHYRPVDPARGRAAGPMVVVRCLECGGHRVHEYTTTAVLIDGLPGPTS